MCPFEFPELYEQLVIGGVRDLRIIQYVIAVLVVAEFLSQFFDFSLN